MSETNYEIYHEHGSVYGIHLYSESLELTLSNAIEQSQKMNEIIAVELSSMVTVKEVFPPILSAVEHGMPYTLILSAVEHGMPYTLVCFRIKESRKYFETQLGREILDYV